MEYRVLGRTGLKVSTLGLGGAPLGGGFEQTSDDEVRRVIHKAIDQGINFLDTAPLYGQSEERIGQSLGKRRDQVVLATKVVNRGESFSYESTLHSVQRSLQRLQTDYIDLVQIHDADQIPFEQGMNETLPALQHMRKEGNLRYIGVTSRDIPLLMRYMNTNEFDCVQIFSRHMLIDHTAREEILPLARKLNMGTINASVLGMGIVAENPAPFIKEGEVLTEATRRIQKLDFLRTKEEKGGLVEPAMRFSMSNPDMHVTLTGVNKEAYLEENVSFWDGVGLSTDEEARVIELFKGQPLFPMPS